MSAFNNFVQIYLQNSKTFFAKFSHRYQIGFNKMVNGGFVKTGFGGWVPDVLVKMPQPVRESPALSTCPACDSGFRLLQTLGGPDGGSATSFLPPTRETV